jgi:hypothetical protein
MVYSRYEEYHEEKKFEGPAIPASTWVQERAKQLSEFTGIPYRQCLSDVLADQASGNSRNYMPHAPIPRRSGGGYAHSAWDDERPERCVHQ